MNLKDAPIGANLIITEITKTEGMGRLLSMGILPGIRLRLIQKKPLFIFKIGFGRFVVDGTLASIIQVKKI